MPINPYQKYKQQSVMTMTQGEMLVRLYDEVIKQLNLGIVAIEKGDVPARNLALQKAQRILNHFRVTLNSEVEISHNLDMLYEYFISKIIQANVSQTIESIQEVLPMVTELRDSFSQAERSTRVG